MYAQLGNIVFQRFIGFKSYDHSKDKNIVEHALIDGKPLLQSVGTNLDKISLDVLFHEAFCIPEEQIRAIDEARDNGEVLPFILGNGRNLGDFVIRSTSQSAKQMDAQGNLREVTISIELVEHVEPNTELAAVTAAIASGFANAQNTPASIVPLPATELTATNPNPAVAASALVVSTSSAANGVNRDLETIKKFPAQASYKMAVISSRAQGMARDVTALQNILANPGKVQESAEALADHLPSLLSTVNLLATQAGGGSLTLVQDTNTVLQSSVATMRTLSGGLTALKSTR